MAALIVRLADDAIIIYGRRRRRRQLNDTTCAISFINNRYFRDVDLGSFCRATSPPTTDSNIVSLIGGFDDRSRYAVDKVRSVIFENVGTRRS